MVCASIIYDNRKCAERAFYCLQEKLHDTATIRSLSNRHEKMRDKIDFKKIIHNGTLIGVLNFNLMIPVEDAQIQRIDTKIRKHDNADTRKKKEL